MAMKMDKRAAYIGTVMKALTDLPNARSLTPARRVNDWNLEDGG